MADISAATGRFALQLPGFSHGGQTSLSVLGPPLLPFLGQCYPGSRCGVGAMVQHTSGASGCSVRTGG